MRSPAPWLVAIVLVSCTQTGSVNDAAVDGGSVADRDAFRDCSAICTRSVSSCDCSMTCHGHLVAAVCTGGTCACTSDGASTFSYATRACDAYEFLAGCQGMPLPDAGTNDAGTTIDAGLDAGIDAQTVTAPPPTYSTATRTISSGGVDRTYVLATPSDIATRGSLPLVFALHGDGGSGSGMRTSLPLEMHFRTATGAVFVYPNAPGGSFEYWTDSGRRAEAQFVRDVIAALHTELGIDTASVFVAGFSGGATMTNALACLLGPSVLRGVGVHSGTLYSVDGPSGPEFTYIGSGVSCPLPDAIFVWGENDMTDVSFAFGQSTRDNYLGTASCASTTTTGPISPCVTYDGCTHGVAWCPIPGMAHAIWPSAAEAMGDFFDALP